MKTLLQYKKGDRPTKFMLLEKISGNLYRIEGLLETHFLYEKAIFVALCCIAAICLCILLRLLLR